MKKLLVAMAICALPAFAWAQTPEVCTFDGEASIPSALGAVPKQNVDFTFKGDLGDPGGSCGAPGMLNATGVMLAGSCGGNVHQGTAKAPNPIGDVDFAGVCAGALCVGVSYNMDPAGFVYVLAFDADTVVAASEDCPVDAFKKAVFTGAAIGGSAS